MTQIPGILASAAQSQLTQKQQSKNTEKTRQSSAAAAEKAAKEQAEHREFIRDMAEATGLVVDPDGKNEQETRKRKHLLDLSDPDSEQLELDNSQAQNTDAEARDHAAALLMESDSSGPQAPPPCMIDIEA